MNGPGPVSGHTRGVQHAGTGSGYPGYGGTAGGADTGAPPWYGSGPSFPLVLRHFGHFAEISRKS